MANEIVLFETNDKAVTLSVPIEQDTVWLNRQQMAELFDRDIKTIGKHIGNALKEELDMSTVANFATVQKYRLTYDKRNDGQRGNELHCRLTASHYQQNDER